MSCSRRPCQLVPVLLLVLVGTGPVSAAITDDGGRINDNDVSRVVRAEIRAGLREEVSKHLRLMTAAKQQADKTKFDDLLTDLKELLLTYDQKGQGQLSQGQIGRGQRSSPSCSTPRILSEKMDNLTSLILEFRQNSHRSRAHSCADLRLSGQTVSGVYTIHPRGLGPVRVYCDMTTDGGGWMVFQRRINGSVNFFRNWVEYADGFGDVRGSHWLGLRVLHDITHTDRHALRIHLADFDGNSRFAVYNFFAISSEITKFRLDLGFYTGDAGDALEHSRDHRFSTKDRDNDNHPNEHCATRYTSGWWYNSCYRANLNGQYLAGHHRLNQGITWNQWRGDTYSLRSTTMMIRPVDFTV